MQLSATEDELEKTKVRKELELHHRKAEKGYEMLRDQAKAAKEAWNGKGRAFDREPCTIDATDMYTFDFQQNLPLPTLTHSDVFYCRQLWVYNFGIHDCIADEGIMHLWDETTAKRGSSEVASCLQRCLSQRSTGAKSLVLFSDGCAGQNKNRVIATFLLKLIHDGQFEQIDHFFLVRGHTFLPNDRDFSVIEKRKKVEKAYIPADWVKVVSTAKTTKHFETVHMNQDEFLDHKLVATKSSKVKFTDSRNQTLSFREVVWFSYGKSREYDTETAQVSLVSHSEEIWCRYTYSSMEPWKKIKPLKRGAFVVEPQQLYHSRLPIKKAKYNDLVKLSERHLPSEYRSFYSVIPTTEREETNPESAFELQ